MLAQRLGEANPGLKVVGTMSPPFRELTADEARRRRASVLSGWYRPTAKNAPALDFYRRYYTPNNRSIQASGIQPDVTVAEDVPDELHQSAGRL